DVVITMLADDRAVEEVVTGADLVSNLAPNTVHVSMSTLSVALSRRLAELHAQAGRAYVSAPVFGRPEAAAAAKLFIMAAGAPGAEGCAPDPGRRRSGRRPHAHCESSPRSASYCHRAGPPGS